MQKGCARTAATMRAKKLLDAWAWTGSGVALPASMWLGMLWHAVPSATSSKVAGTGSHTCRPHRKWGLHSQPDDTLGGENDRPKW